MPSASVGFHQFNALLRLISKPTVEVNRLLRRVPAKAITPSHNGCKRSLSSLEQALLKSVVFRDTLLARGDFYMHLADLRSYLDADRRLVELYAQPEDWTRRAILNVANFRFSHLTPSPSGNSQPEEHFY